MTKPAKTELEKEAQRELPDSLKQPVWHVLVLSWLTMLAYLFYWFYKNWRDLSKQEALATAAGDEEQSTALKPFKDISPMLRTISLFVPGLNVYFYITQFLGIAQLIPDANSFPRRHPLLAAGLIIGSFISLTALFSFRPPIFFLGLLAAIPFAVVQHWLNTYWDKVEPNNVMMRHAFSVKELIVIILGGLLLGLNVVGTMLGVKDH